MIRHGHPPFLECSSRGDINFSALYATVEGRSIEQWYQEAKVFDCDVSNLTWKERRGLPCENQKEVRQLYADLWDRYIRENPHLLSKLMEASGLSDVFGKTGHACQATELWRIRNSLFDWWHLEGGRAGYLND